MSNPPNVTSYTWGPGAQRAAVSVTFDNLGEPADLERGLWPEREPLGRHFSVKRMLPRTWACSRSSGFRPLSLPCPVLHRIALPVVSEWYQPCTV
jgi:hypothetical protein